MGIEKFSQYFKSAVIQSVESSPSRVYIDGSLYWERALNTHPNLDERDFYMMYFGYICKNLLYKLIQAQSCNLELAELVFDDPQKRPYLKMWKCYQRSTAQLKLQKKRISWSLDQLNHYFSEYMDEFYDDMARGALIPAERFKTVFKIVCAPADTDDYISNLLTFREANPEGKSVFTIDSDYIQHTASDIAVFSGDSDFVSFFPDSAKICVVDYEDVCVKNNAVAYCLTLCNYAFNEDHDVIKGIREIATETINLPTWLTTDFLMDLCIKCLAMTSKNDYITFSCFSTEALAAAKVQMDTLCSLKELCDKSTYASGFALVFLAECIRREARQASRFKFLLQNILRIFVYDIVEQNFDHQSDLEEYMKNTPMDEVWSKVKYRPFDYTPQSSNESIKVDTFAHLLKLLKSRPVFFDNKDSLKYIEANFKATMWRNLEAPTKFSIGNVLARWIFQMYEFLDKKLYAITIDSTTKRPDVSQSEQVILHLGIGNIISQCLVIVYIGLLRVWFNKVFDKLDFDNKVLRLILHRIVETIYTTCVPTTPSKDGVFVKAYETVSVVGGGGKRRKYESPNLEPIIGFLNNPFTAKDFENYLVIHFRKTFNI